MFSLLLALIACVPDGADHPETAETAPPDDIAHDSETDSLSGESGGDSSHSGETDTHSGETDSHTGETGESGDTNHTGDTSGPTSPPAVILFIGDGMGFEHVAGGGVYLTGAAGSLSMETLPYQGRIRSSSLSGITDSAAAATTYASGYKTYNSRLGLDGDGEEVENLVEVARALGMSTGVVTTDTVTGATPSGFLVHVRGRGDTVEIAEQEVASPPDVLMGGGSDFLVPLLDTSVVQLVTDADGLAASVIDSRPFFGLFAGNTFPWLAEGYTTQPSLATMTDAALTRLDTNPEGFFLMVEGARIDHASHGRHEDFVHVETVGFDDAVAAAMAWAEGRDNVTIIVTADHECGGMTVEHTGTAGEIPTTTWRWSQHTNVDPPVFAMGDRASVFDGARSDSRLVHEVLIASLEQRDVGDLEPIFIPDGWFEDLGDPDVIQTLDTDYGAGLNQLDGLVAYSDEEGLRFGVSGVFERDQNTVVLLLDVDFGEGTGLGGVGAAEADTDGTIEALLSSMSLDVDLDGLGFDLALLSIGANEVDIEDLGEEAGLRGLREPWATDADWWWLNAAVNVDDGNVAVGGVEALDAGATGTTEGGLEFWVPWDAIYPDGLPGLASQVAVVAVLVNTTGEYASDQALPPLAAAPSSGAAPIAITSALVMDLDDLGVMVGDPLVSD